ncbi:hypothetical protein [Tolypothrix sp. VBCCA 56010]
MGGQGDKGTRRQGGQGGRPLSTNHYPPTTIHYPLSTIHYPPTTNIN